MTKPRSAHVLFKDKIAGTLTETSDGGTLFAYDQTWNEPIACCFPIARREYYWKQGLHPFFQHLGAEGWLREKQARISHVAEEDDFGLLLRYGADCIGAVGIVPKDEMNPLNEIKENSITPGKTISGVQPKLLVKKDKNNAFVPAEALGPAPYIAKFNSLTINTLIRNEHLCLRWVSAVLGKNEVTEFCQSPIPTLNQMALIVTRFDRKNGEKLRLEDCAQILCKPSSNYNGKYEAAYEDIAEIILKYSSRAPIDLLQFFKRLIVFTLVGNCDAHLKNFSLLETPTGLRLSPVYDVVNTAMYPEYSQNLALSICGKKIARDDADQKLFIRFGKEIGLSDRIINQTFNDLKKQVLKAVDIIKPPAAEDPDGFMHRFEEIVRNACTRILP